MMYLLDKNLNEYNSHVILKLHHFMFLTGKKVKSREYKLPGAALGED